MLLMKIRLDTLFPYFVNGKKKRKLGKAVRLCMCVPMEVSWDGFCLTTRFTW